MYQYNDRLTQLFAKYKHICFRLQCFDPYLGHQAYIMNLESVVRDPVWHENPKYLSRYNVRRAILIHSTCFNIFTTV
jgi:hypothetical protein